ncbi:MAG: hypothetical protein SVV03_02200 [Candidatus Nanohaloarchaea archaeon]|nr:hypothetical protein [Candidatus Nanohaloarchaea archaeon]
MAGEDRKKLDEWSEKLDADIPGSGDGSSLSSREYDIFKEAEREAEQRNWYEKLTEFSGRLFHMEPFEDMEEDLENAVDLLRWDVDLEEINPTGITWGLVSAVLLYPSIILPIPLIFKLIALVLPIGIFIYLIFYPIIAAKRKVITGSGDLIMAVLYMVVYMRSSPNLEGAVSFVASNMQGDIAKDFRRMLWSVQVGNFTGIDEALDRYKEVWRPYNKDFVETVNILGSALQERSQEKRLELFSEAIDNLLGATRNKMKEYARDLKTPVMVVQGIGVLLPVLIMILFPLMSAFIGGEGLAIYLFAGYNILLPGIVYLIMRQVLLSRPPTTSSNLMEEGKLPPVGQYSMRVFGRSVNVPLWSVCLLLFLVLGYWPLQHYLQVLLGYKEFIASPSWVEMLRSLIITFSAAVSVGLYFVLGYKERLEKQKEIEEIESEFPEALYMLGDSMRRGTPIEIALNKAIKNTEGLNIQQMLKDISVNIRSMGMTFDQAVFDEKQGVIWNYPSNLIKSIMKAVRESTGKGTSIVSSAMKTISNYLKQVKETQRKIEDVMSDTLSTMVFIAYILAPVVSGVAVGMGTVITQSFAQISEIFTGVKANISAGGAGGQAPGGGTLGGIGSAPTDLLGFSSGVSPEIMQLVVGLYLIQISFLLGTFYSRISEGISPAKRWSAVGKILIFGSLIYTVAAFLLILLFGGIISQVGGIA